MRLGLLSLVLILMIGSLASAAQTKPGPAVDFLGWSGGISANYWRQRGELVRNLDQAAADQKPARRLDLVRFYLAHDDAPEALGLLAGFGEDRQVSSEVVLYRGIAELMQGHPAVALRHLSDSQLAGSSHARLWSGLAHASRRDWSAARNQWAAAGAISGNYPRQWRARFVSAQIETAFGLDDLETVRSLLDREEGEVPKVLALLPRQLFQGRSRQAGGEVDAALADFGNVAAQAEGALAAEARFRFLALRLTSGQARAAAIRLELRELSPLIDSTPVAFEYHQLAAQLAEQAGEPFAALSHLRSARHRTPARRYRLAARTAIERLMLSALGPGEEPKSTLISRVRGFYQVQDLLPVGDAGDRIVLAHAGRLAALDLLGPAEELLAYQVAERLNGTGRARAALRLAEIRLALARPSLARLSAGIAGHSRLGYFHAIRLRLVRARILAKLGDVSGALALLEGLDWDPAVKLKGDLYLRQGRGELARNSYRLLLTNLSVRGLDGDQAAQFSEDRILRRHALASALAGSTATDAPPGLRFIANQSPLPPHPTGDDIDRFAGLDALSAVTNSW